MNTYKVNWNRNDYGYIVIEAMSEQEAKEKFLSCDWDEKDLVIRDGGMDIDSVEEEE